VLTAACAFESMLDVQIFCTEELKSLQERLNGTLKRATGLLTTGINPERVEEGNKQLGILLKEFEDSLATLNKQKQEEEEKAKAKGVEKVPTTITKRLADASAAAAATIVSKSAVSTT
jgi:hypothetical protein